jgi:hypothetical protein
LADDYSESTSSLKVTSLQFEVLTGTNQLRAL